MNLLVLLIHLLEYVSRVFVHWHTRSIIIMLRDMDKDWDKKLMWCEQSCGNCKWWDEMKCWFEVNCQKMKAKPPKPKKPSISIYSCWSLRLPSEPARRAWYGFWFHFAFQYEICDLTFFQTLYIQQYSGKACLGRLWRGSGNIRLDCKISSSGFLALAAAVLYNFHNLIYIYCNDSLLRRISSLNPFGDLAQLSNWFCLHNLCEFILPSPERFMLLLLVITTKCSGLSSLSHQRPLYFLHGMKSLLQFIVAACSFQFVVELHIFSIRNPLGVDRKLQDY
jgi:hypothetical protein